MIEEFRELLTPRGQSLVPGHLDPDGDELARIFLEPLTDGRGPSTEEAIQAEIDADPDAVLQKADVLMLHRVSLLGGYAEQELGDPLDWYRAPRDDWQWPTHLSRHGWMAPLGLAYRHTGEERYARAIVDLLVDWQQKFPLGAPGCDWAWKVPLDDPEQRPPSGEGLFAGYFDGPWTSLSARSRLATWLRLLQMIWNAKAVTNGALARLLSSLWTDHLRLMYDFPRNRNQFQGIAIGLINVGWHFPLFKGAAAAESVGWERMGQYVRDEIYPDGSFAECSPNYGLGCLHRLQDLLSQATERKLAIPALMTERMAGAVRYFAFTSDPLGRSARIAKGGEDVRRQLGLINSMVEDPAVRFVVSGGAEGELPPSCVSYSWAGHHVMRSGWDADATWLFFDSGPRGSGHHDMAQNGIQLISGRRWLLADSGYYSYSASGPDGEMARYLKSSAAHNTALVNGACQLPFAPGSRLRPNVEEGDYRWHQDEETASAEGTYLYGYGAEGEIDVRHRRKVSYTKKEDLFTVADEFTGEGDADVWLHWQVPVDADLCVAGKAVAVRAADRTLHLTFESDREVAVSQFRGEKDPILGWFSKRYGHLEEATLVRAAISGPLPLRIETRLAVEHTAAR